MSGRILIAIFLLGLFGFRAEAQDIITDISQYQIELRHTFKGQELLLFGAIPEGARLEQAQFDVVIIITGEARTHEVWKKERTLGFWINSSPLIFENVPEYYALASTRLLPEVAPAALLDRLSLGIERQRFAVEGNLAGHGEYVNGIIHFKEGEGLYQVATEEMPIQSGVLFRASFFFPANVPSGSYTASAYLFQDGLFIGRTDKAIKIDKAGFERDIYLLAHDQPALYGILAILIALLAGWLASFITRKRAKIG